MSSSNRNSFNSFSFGNNKVLEISSSAQILSGISNKKEDDWQVPQLPVLDEIFKEQKDVDFKNYLFVCGQHNLNTTASLFETIIKSGAQKENIFVVGKIYSNSEIVSDWLKKHTTHIESSVPDELGNFISSYNDDITILWLAAIDRITKLRKENQPIDGIIILDDGGHVLTKIPSKLRKSGLAIVGIEQTSSGIIATKSVKYPVIMVASCAIKNEIEPLMVADAIGSKIEQHLSKIKGANFLHEQSSSASIAVLEETLKPIIQNKFEPLFANKEALFFGIVGFGHIGEAVLKQLHGLGYKNFIVMDKDQSKCDVALALGERLGNVVVRKVTQLGALVGNAHIVIGCTGKDITADEIDNAFSPISSPKILLSCSSKDTEFLTLLKHIEAKRRTVSNNVVEDIIFQNGFQSPIMILRGGFPINFDNSEKSVKECDIELIRGLKYQAILQAYTLIQASKNQKNAIVVKNYSLDADRQLQTFNLWVGLKRPSNPKYFRPFERRYSLGYLEAHSKNSDEQEHKFLNDPSLAQTARRQNSLTVSENRSPYFNGQETPQSEEYDDFTLLNTSSRSPSNKGLNNP